MRKLAGGVAATLVALAVAAAPAMASHGGGGGGGGGGNGGGGGGGGGATAAGAPGGPVSAAGLNHGAVAVGTTSPTQTVTITNTGTASLFINGVGVPQGGGGFVEVSSAADCIAATIPPGGSCSIIVVFAPTVTGAQTSTISVLDTAANGQTLLTYTGVGTSTTGP